jgi:hypothetical protein
MHYVVKEGISANLVADANSLMREFYRADKAINNLDQNNVKSASINYDTTFDPAHADTYKRGCTRTHYPLASGLLDVLSKDFAAPTLVEDKWVKSTTLLEFNLATTTPMAIYTSGQFDNVAAATGPLRADVALYYNGEILGVPQCFSGAAHTGTVEIPFMLSATVLLPSGDCAISVGFVSRGADVPVASRINVSAVGYAR